MYKKRMTVLAVILVISLACVYYGYGWIGLRRVGAGVLGIYIAGYIADFIFNKWGKKKGK